MTSSNDKVVKQQYRELVEFVSSVIAEWDPYGLLEGGAPGDEFDTEITQIAVQVRRLQSAEHAAKVISQVFSSSFEPALFPPEACADVGRRLFLQLQANGFVAHPR